MSGTKKRTTRKPFHESIIQALETAARDPNMVTNVPVFCSLTGLLDTTVIPADHLLRLARQLRELAANSPGDWLLRQSANRLMRLYRRRIA